jgi:hypothetical protein
VGQRWRNQQVAQDLPRRFIRQVVPAPSGRSDLPSANCEAGEFGEHRFRAIPIAADHNSKAVVYQSPLSY